MKEVFPRHVLIVGLLLAGSVMAPALADSSLHESGGVMPDLANSAVERYASTDLEAWYYTRTWVSGDEVVIDRHDPSLPGAEHWQLVSIDGHAPTPAEIEDYESERDSHEDGSDDRFNNADVMKMLAPGTVQLMESDDGSRVYGFQMQSPNGKRKRLYESMQGAIRVVEDERGPLVEMVRVWNVGPIYPALGVRISQASVDFSFATHNGHVLPSGVDVRFQGRAFLVKKLDREFRVRLTDFSPLQ
jgi:hypothetical protein